MDGALAPGTVNAYESRVRSVAKFAEAHNLKMFPFTPALLTAYGIAYCAGDGTGQRNARSLSGVVTAVRWKESQVRLHLASMRPHGNIDDIPRSVFVDDRFVNRLIIGLSRLFQPVSHQKAPLLLEFLVKIWAGQGALDWTLRRDRALLSVGHAGLFRIGELLSLVWGDVELIEKEGEIVEAVFIIRHAKTSDPSDPVTGGAQLARVGRLPPGSASWCALSFFLDYARDTGALEPGSSAFSRDWSTAPVFPASSGDKFGRPLKREESGDIIRAGLASIGFSEADRARYSNHSLRSGGATDYYASGESVEKISERGRWRSEAVFVYLRQHARLPTRGVGLRPGAGDLDRALALASSAGRKRMLPDDAPQEGGESEDASAGGTAGPAAAGAGPAEAGAAVPSASGPVAGGAGAGAGAGGRSDYEGGAPGPAAEPAPAAPSPGFEDIPLLRQVLEDIRNEAGRSAAAAALINWAAPHADGAVDGRTEPTADTSVAAGAGGASRSGAGPDPVLMGGAAGAGAGAEEGRPLSPSGHPPAEPKVPRGAAGYIAITIAGSAVGQVVRPTGHDSDGTPLYLVSWPDTAWPPSVEREDQLELRDPVDVGRPSRSRRRPAAVGDPG